MTRSTPEIPVDGKDMTTLDEMMECALSQGRDTIERGDEVTSQFIALGGDGGLRMYVTPWGSETDKALILAMLKADFAEHEVVRYVLLSEAWTAEKVPGDDRLPADRPDRKEKLVVLGIERARRRAVIVPIIREGAKRRCGEPDWNTTISSPGGRMTELLPAEQLDAIQRT